MCCRSSRSRNKIKPVLCLLFRGTCWWAVHSCQCLCWRRRRKLYFCCALGGSRRSTTGPAISYSISSIFASILPSCTSGLQTPSRTSSCGWWSWRGVPWSSIPIPAPWYSTKSRLLTVGSPLSTPSCGWSWCPSWCLICYLKIVSIPISNRSNISSRFLTSVSILWRNNK